MAQTSTPEVHDEFGPSKHPALCRCPAYKSKSGDSVHTALGVWKHDRSYDLWQAWKSTYEGGPDQKVNVYDEILHGMMEKVRDGWVINWNEGDERKEYRIKMIDAEQAVQGVEQLVEFYQWLCRTHPDEKFEDRCEKRVPLKNIGLKKGGTPDVMFVGQTVAACMDYKYGQKIVHPWTEQLMSYLSGVMADNPFIKWTFYSGIIQPTVREDKAWTVEVSAEHIERHANMMIDIIKIAKTPNPPCRPNEYCNYCADFPCATVEARTKLATRQTMELDPDALTIDESGKLLDFFGELKQCAGALERNMVLRLKDGEPSEYWQLVEGRRTRVWTDQDDAEKVLKVICEEKGIDPLELYQMKFVSPAQAEKLVGKAKAVREAIGNVVMQKHGELKLGRKKDED